MSRVSLLPRGEHRLLDRYQLIGEIASGGMASVFLARLPGVGGFQRMVAIKRLHPHLAREPAFVDMFLDEARLAASIHHRNVVPILEIGTSDSGYYLVMEYIEGVTLARMMTHASATRSSVPWTVLMRVVVDTLSGLHAAHELTDPDGTPLGVVHRDCSPQNILIGHDGCSRITDFGIARARARLHNTRDGAMKGKLAYMAPEQTEGEAFDRRADIFSVGAVMWELLTGKRLFKARTEAQTLKRLLHDPIPSVREVRQDVHPALDAVCLKALSRKSEGRFETAAEMADAVEAAARLATPDGDGIASDREVETLMKTRFGAQSTQQREAVRVFLQGTPTMMQQAPATDRGWLARTSKEGRLEVMESAPDTARAGSTSNRPPPIASQALPITSRPPPRSGPPASSRPPPRPLPPTRPELGATKRETVSASSRDTVRSSTPSGRPAPVSQPLPSDDPLQAVAESGVYIEPLPEDWSGEEGSEQETTNVYEPHSLESAAHLGGHVSGPSSLPVSSIAGVPRQRDRSVIVLAAAALLVVIFSVALILRRSREPTGDDQQAQTEDDGGRREGAHDSAAKVVPSHADRPIPAPREPQPPLPISPQPVPDKPGPTKPGPKPSPPPGPKPAPDQPGSTKPGPKPEPGPEPPEPAEPQPPQPKGDDLDDLSNPYR